MALVTYNQIKEVYYPRQSVKTLKESELQAVNNNHLKDIEKGFGVVNKLLIGPHTRF